MQFWDTIVTYFRNFSMYLGTSQWQDYTEIIIIAILLYFTMKWMKNTRAWSLLKGLLVVLIFVLFAKVFHMDTILWLFSNILQFGVIALIVVLQPELRKALETLGRSNILGSVLYFGQQPGGDYLSDASIREIVRACSQMGRVRTGALIVIENKESINRIDETGIKVDAEITSQLLINIFEKNTPLHDGAVTVRNNRVSSATCYLPLSTSDMISKELGTRHRAAMGMSEESDAVIVVVSEETGRISVAHDGILDTNITDETLTRILLSTVGKNTEEESEKNAKGKRRRRKHEDT